MEKKEIEKIAEKLKIAKVDIFNDNIHDIWDKLIQSGQYVEIGNKNEKDEKIE